MTVETFRAESDADFGQLHDLFVEYEDDLDEDLRHGAVPDAAGLKRTYEEGSAAFLAAGKPGSIGCVAVKQVDEKTAAIRHLFVKPSARGAGAARALVQAAFDFARERGYSRIVLDTAKERLQAAYHLYLSLGFRECTPYTTVDYRCPTFMEIYLQ